MNQRLGIALIALSIGLAGSTPARAQDTTSPLGSIRLTKATRANDQPLPAGRYDIRLTNTDVAPAVGQSPQAETWVEFTQHGKVVGRAVATVIKADDMAAIAKGPKPRMGTSRVETLKGGDYVRVWIARGGMNYLINLRAAGH